MNRIIQFFIRERGTEGHSQRINLPEGHPVPRIGEYLDLSAGTFKVIGVTWSFHEDAYDSIDTHTTVTLQVQRAGAE